MAGVLCLLVEYAWVVPLQRKPAAQEFCRRAGEGVAEWAGLEGTMFQFWMCLFLR